MMVRTASVLPILIVAACLGSSARAALAQDTAAGNAARGSFWVTEAGYSHSVSGLCSDHYPSFEIGKLANLEGSLAVGGTFFIGHNEDVVFGPMPRLRYWTSDEVALDFAGGLLWGASRVRPTTYVSLNYRDLIAGFAQYERYRDGGCGAPAENQVFFGVKIGSRPGVYTAAIGGAIAAVIIAVVVSQVEN